MTTITTFNQLAPIIIQQYQDYLPNAFDDNLTLLQKVNKIIQSLSSTNDTVNNLIDQWNNEIVNYVNGDGFTTDVNNKLDSMASDGTLASLLNNEALGQIGDIHADVKYPPNNLTPCKGDGNTDDTSALQAIINYVVGLGGGTIFLPQGTYKITSTLNWKCNDISFVGSGRSVTVILPYSTDAIHYGDSTGVTRYNYNTLKNFKVDMTNSPANNGVTNYNSDEFTHENVIVTKGNIGTYISGGYNGEINKCINVYQSLIGLKMDCADKTEINKGQNGNGVKGVQIMGGKAIKFKNVSIERNTDEAVQLMSSHLRGGEYPQGITFDTCYMERNAQQTGNGYIEYGTYDSSINDYCKDILVTGCYFNWDTANPRTPIVPIHFFDKASAVTLISNQYANTSTYASRTSNTDLNRLVSLNDNADMGRFAMRTSKGQLWESFSVSIPTDVNGHGSYNYDTSTWGVTVLKALGHILGTKAVPDFVYTGGTQVQIIVDGQTPSSNVTVEGIIMGTQ